MPGGRNVRVFAELKNSVARRSEWEGGGTGQVERGTQSPRLPSFQYRWLPFDDRAENHISSLLQGGLQAATREGTQRASGEAAGSTRRLSRCQERGCSLGLKTWESEELTETQKVRFPPPQGDPRPPLHPCWDHVAFFKQRPFSATKPCYRGAPSIRGSGGQRPGGWVLTTRPQPIP